MIESTAATIERRLRERFIPERFELIDDSARHAGHRGATSGGGHYDVVVVSSAFEGMSQLERHRAVNETLRELFGARIHALGLHTWTPGEYSRR